jgi:hypothetical protein
VSSTSSKLLTQLTTFVGRTENLTITRQLADTQCRFTLTDRVASVKRGLPLKQPQHRIEHEDGYFRPDTLASHVI